MLVVVELSRGTSGPEGLSHLLGWLRPTTPVLILICTLQCLGVRTSKVRRAHLRAPSLVEIPWRWAVVRARAIVRHEQGVVHVTPQALRSVFLSNVWVC